MAQFLDSIVIEYNDGSAWVDISAYVVGDIKGNGGLGGWKPDQRVAVLGTLNITLNNIGKYFSPMGGDDVRGLDTLTGFNKGAKIRVRGVYGAFSKVIWTGRIASLDSDDKNWGKRQTRLMAVDWMHVPSNFPMAGASISLNKRIDEAMPLILARLSTQPEDTDFETGSFTFPAVFDNVKRKTMALSEFTKLANSELGYIYVRHDGTLVAEGMMTRHGWRALDTFWSLPDTDSYLLMEDGFFLLNEDGGKFILDEGSYETVAISSDAEEYNILLPEDCLLNASIINAHPVITDTSLKVLYKLGTPLFVPAGQTAEFSAHYTDPSGLNQVSGTNMQAPVATTDYLANTASDGSGTNKTANVTVTATYYGDTVYYQIANAATVGVYITFLQARGYGIYYGNSIEATIEDAVSQAAFGYAPFQFDQRYQKNSYLADMYGLSVIEEYKNPKSRITKMRYLANLNKNHLMSFLSLTVGALFLLTEDRSGISNHYYVTDRSFLIQQGGIIHCEYGVKQNDCYLSGGLNPITVEFAGGSATDGIHFQNSAVVVEPSTKSFSVWVYPDSYSVGGDGDTIFAIGSPFAAEFLYLSTNKLAYIRSFASSGGWTSPTNTPALSEWSHIVVTFDSSIASNDPIIYINGAAVVVTESSTPSGSAISLQGATIDIGNASSLSVPYGGCFDGKIFDPRIYNRILTADEVATLYNAGVPDHTLVTDGLVFQGLAVYADKGDADSLDGTSLSSSDRLVENILRAVGIPHGAPVIRANP